MDPYLQMVFSVTNERTWNWQKYFNIQRGSNTEWMCNACRTPWHRLLFPTCSCTVPLGPHTRSHRSQAEANIKFDPQNVTSHMVRAICSLLRHTYLAENAMDRVQLVAADSCIYDAIQNCRGGWDFWLHHRRIRLLLKGVYLCNQDNRMSSIYLRQGDASAKSSSKTRCP
jgi:hypothetical protein